MPVTIALPKGRLLEETAALLQRAGWGISGYSTAERYYRLKSRRFPGLAAKVFHERDIPVQVAVGNYDLGVCGADWVEELLARYPSSAVIRVKELGYGEDNLVMAGAPVAAGEVMSKPGVVRIASEYPNLAESFALRRRIRRFSVFPLWGAAEVYPPESADLALVRSRNGGLRGLVPVSTVLASCAVLIANRRSWETKDMSELLSTVPNVPLSGCPPVRPVADRGEPARMPEDALRLALPDGHQQVHAVRLLERAGISVEGYSDGNRRPACSLKGVAVKVIRPQDMPLQVANGNFDLAVTGKDWLREHRYQFPGSPVTELLDLGFGRVRVVAVVSRDLPVSCAADLRRFAASGTPLRVASEYVNIADRYARDNHLAMYRVIPTWGATEAFVPEDADLLIENTETGRTIARHGLKIVETLMESTACLVGNTDSLADPAKSGRIEHIAGMLRQAVEKA